MHALSTSAVCAHALSPNTVCSAVDTSTPDPSTIQSVPNTCIRTQPCFRTHESDQSMLLHSYAAKNGCQILTLIARRRSTKTPAARSCVLRRSIDQGTSMMCERGRAERLLQPATCMQATMTFRQSAFPSCCNSLAATTCLRTASIIYTGAQHPHSAAHCMSEVMMWARQMLLCRTLMTCRITSGELAHAFAAAGSSLSSSLTLSPACQMQ
jgi:hypothetical protein